MNVKGQLTYIDLFAGCGGLSLGLKRAGFHLLVAVEKSPMAAETFYHNFIRRLPSARSDADVEWQSYLGLPIERQVERGLVVNDVRSFIDSGQLDALAEEDVDLVAGGPPCQGFSLAGRRDPADVRNQLPWQFLEVVQRVQPKLVIIENVAGIAQNFVKHGAEAPFVQLTHALKAIGPGYLVQPMRVNAKHFGVPEHRSRMLLVGIRSDLVVSLGNQADLRSLGHSLDLPLWKSESPEAPLLAPRPAFLGNERTVSDALWDLVDNGEGLLQYSCPAQSSNYFTSAGEFARLMRSDAAWLPPAITEAVPPQEPINRTSRKHARSIIHRFELYQYANSKCIPPNIMNLPVDSSLTPDEREAAVRKMLTPATYPATLPTGRVIAETADELVDLVMRSGTKKHSQRPLRADAPAPTVMSLPDDFVHHLYPRTLTVRELARLQSFPDLFEFRSKETTGSSRRRFEVPQYTQVGNAVPPLLGFAVGDRLATLLQ